MIVIKYGGNALPSDNSTDPVLEAIADAFLDGEQIVLVHGGGPQIDAALTEKGLGKEKIAGYRITSEQVFTVVQSVLSGQVLRSIVNYLIGSDVNAVGLSASDGGLIRARKFKPIGDGKAVDFGDAFNEVIDSYAIYYTDQLDVIRDLQYYDWRNNDLGIDVTNIGQVAYLALNELYGDVENYYIKNITK